MTSHGKKATGNCGARTKVPVSKTTDQRSFASQYVNTYLRAPSGLLESMPEQLQKNYNIFADTLIAQGIISSMISAGILSDKEIFELENATNDRKKAELLLDTLGSRDLIGLCALREGLHATGQVDLLELIEGRHILDQHETM